MWITVYLLVSRLLACPVTTLRWLSGEAFIPWFCIIAGKVMFPKLGKEGKF